MVALASACQSVPEGDAPVRDGLQVSAPEAREAAPDAPAALPAPGRDPATFIGSDVAVLDAYLGKPALIRREGRNAFHRYDLDDCRAFAVVAPAGGLVQALSTGPLNNGEAAPSFEACTAGL